MSCKIRVLATERQDELWDAFLADHAEASFCHLSSWKRIIEGVYGHPCHYLFCQQGASISGVLPLVHVSGLLAPNRLVSVPFLDQGGVLATNNEASDALLAAALELTRRVGARGVDLRYSSAVEGSLPRQNDRYRFVIPLPESSEELWRSLGSKVRNQIRKAEKSGLETRLAPPEELSSFFQVFSRNMRDLGSPTHSERFFRLMAAQLGERFSLYLTRNAQEEVIAGAIAVRFNNTITVPWASSLRSARPMCPNHSFYWEILQQAVRSEAAEFDFGRSTEGSGTFLFKKQWSTELRPLRWEFLSPEGLAEKDYLLDSRRNGALQRSWCSLPVPLTRALGPWIRRRLPN